MIMKSKTMTLTQLSPNYLPDSNHSIRPPILVTGGFDPLHSGHIDYFNAAKELGEILVVGLNSDAWLSRKKGQPFMPFDERKTILQSLEVVDYVLKFDDDDESSCTAIEEVIKIFGKCTFANGGDRGFTNTPEVAICEEMGIPCLWGVGGDRKLASSSDLVKSVRSFDKDGTPPRRYKEKSSQK